MRSILKAHMVFGNKKLPTTTAIFNICAAHDCPSAKRGMCQVLNGKHRCYALRDEQQYKATLAYRRRQETLWDSFTASSFVAEFVSIMGRRRLATTALRLNESGDFRSQADVRKAAIIARKLAEYGVTVYGYTARRDLDFSKVGPLVVNGSGFKVNGEFRFVRTKADLPKGYKLCPGDCRTCTRCLTGKLTGVLPH